MKIIGISGVARSGKDTLAVHLKNAIEATAPNKRVLILSLAQTLKQEMYDFVLERFAVDLFSCSGRQKEILRPLMVAYGYAKRQQTEGRYFLDAAERVMNQSGADIVIIPDIRYAEFDTDEVQWLKNEKKGLLFHVSKFIGEGDNKTLVEAPNEDERKNDPILKAAATKAISWDHFGDEALNQKAREVAETILNENLSWIIS